MAKVKTFLTNEEIQKLVAADACAKSAKTAFDVLKDQLCKDLPAGKYFAEGIGAVYKTAAVRGIVDYKRLLADHPEIDVEKYTNYTEVSSVSVKNMTQETSIFSKLLKR